MHKSNTDIDSLKWRLSLHSSILQFFSSSILQRPEVDLPGSADSAGASGTGKVQRAPDSSCIVETMLKMLKERLPLFDLICILVSNCRVGLKKYGKTRSSSRRQSFRHDTFNYEHRFLSRVFGSGLVDILRSASVSNFGGDYSRMHN